SSTELFAHLQQYKRTTVSSLLQQPAIGNIHPAILQLGMRYADGSIRGANARCLAMLNALCQVIRDYTTPEGKELPRDLLRHLNDHVNFLVVCRPLSVGMGNAIRHLKLRISTISPDMPEGEAKELLEQEIADYINARIDSADKQLVSYAVAKVEAQGDVILTYAASHVVQRALVEAAGAGKSFRVVVMDSRPELEGRATLARLMAAGIPCTYVHLNAASYIIREVTKVFLGAAAVLSNGTVLSRAGTAAVAMMAHAHSKPVMICCETHKFNERVQLDSITHNELGDPEALAVVSGKPEVTALEGWSEHPRLRLLNLKYDLMPAEYVTMVVTEFGMVPPTSVPVILREFRQSEQTVSGPF
ncbi:eukaryotic translation initiation factor 2B delta, partial [Volvox carteri f. nagariensis]